MTHLEDRSQHEIEHGRFLAESGNPEKIWNWDSPAGQVRARRRGDLLRQGAGLRPGMRVLEVGCGTGLFTSMLAQEGMLIIATDLSPDLLAIARQRQLDPAQVQWREMRFEDGDAEGPYDAIVGSSVLHHLEMLPSLKRMFDLLKPGGRIAFAEPNLLNPQVWMERHIGPIRRRLGVSPDETAIVRWKLARQLSAIGFADIAIRNIDWLHPATPPALISVVSTIGIVLEQIPLIREFTGSVLISAQKPIS